MALFHSKTQRHMIKLVFSTKKKTTNHVTYPYMGLVVKTLYSGFSNQAMLKQACSATETS